MKKNEDAEIWCKKAVDSNPENAEYTALLAECKILMEEYDEAARLYKKAHELDTKNNAYKEGYHKAQKLVRQAGKRDYYKILGVPRTASQRDIKKAFRKLAQVWHPDKYRGDLPKEKVEAKMGEINQAYEVLSNEELRARFDNGDDPNVSLTFLTCRIKNLTCLVGEILLKDLVDSHSSLLKAVVVDNNSFFNFKAWIGIFLIIEYTKS